MKRISIFAMLAVCAMAAHAESGKIKICRNPSIINMADGKTVKFPPLNYVGVCDKNGDNCRRITVSAEGGTVGKERSACAILTDNLKESDGKPVKAGTRLLPSYISGSGAGDFQDYEQLAEIFISDTKVTVVSDFK